MTFPREDVGLVWVGTDKDGFETFREGKQRVLDVSGRDYCFPFALVEHRSSHPVRKWRALDFCSKLSMLFHSMSTLPVCALSRFIEGRRF